MPTTDSTDDPATSTAADGGSVDLHDLEQQWQDQIPNRRFADESQVTVERPTGDTVLVAAEDDHLIGALADASEDRNRGEARLTGLLVPFKVYTERRGPVEFRRGTKLYYDPEETHVRLEAVRVDEDGRLYAEFREVTSTFPYRTWTFRTIDLARSLEAGDLRTQVELDERAREALGMGEPGSGGGTADGSEELESA